MATKTKDWTPAPQSAEFKKACVEVKKLKADPGQDTQLELYGLFKQGCADPPYEKAPKLGWFDPKGTEMRKAWTKVADKKTSPANAQKEYVQLVNKLKKEHGVNA